VWGWGGAEIWVGLADVENRWLWAGRAAGEGLDGDAIHKIDASYCYLNKNKISFEKGAPKGAPNVICTPLKVCQSNLGLDR